MKNILENLYFGDSNYNTYSCDENSSEEITMLTLQDSENKLLNCLTGEERKIFVDYVDSWDLISASMCLNKFLLGCKVGFNLNDSLKG